MVKTTVVKEAKEVKKRFVSFADYLKEKTLEIGADYLKRNTAHLTKNIQKQLENLIEQKVKKEIRKFAYSMIAILLLTTAILFIIYGLISMGVYYGELPQFMTTLIFGLLLLTIGAVTYVLK